MHKAASKTDARGDTRAQLLPLSPRVGCGATRTLENRHSDRSRASRRPRRRGSKFQNVNFATDGFGCPYPLVSAVTVITRVGCANFGRLSFRYVDSAGLLRVKLARTVGGRGRASTRRRRQRHLVWLAAVVACSLCVTRADHFELTTEGDLSEGGPALKCYHRHATRQ